MPVPIPDSRFPIPARASPSNSDDVWFAYDLAHLAKGDAPPAEPEWVLRGVSFEARPGETLALVGHTGAGKTTIVSLLLRFYDPQRGRILVNGVDIREMPRRRAARHSSATCSRTSSCSPETSRRTSASHRRSPTRTSCARRNASVRIASSDDCPARYAYELGERGTSVSVGERQLLSFARAIAADPALLVLDEATSAVDSEIEAAIQQALEVLMRGRTTIAIAHRLSTIVGANGDSRAASR